MFESLQSGLSTALRSLSGKGKLSEANMREGLKSVQQALLEADVSFSVVKDFMARITEQAIGERVLSSLNPTQQVVGIVHQELIDLMGPVDHALHLRGDAPVLMLCGLQGSGKTTTCGKLARRLKNAGQTPLMVAADLQRPAAIRQLHVLGEQLGIEVYSEEGAQDPVKVCQRAVQKARNLNANVVLLDTAGRLHVDEDLMKELARIDQRVSPQQVLLVVDGMTGQDAVQSAKSFNEALELDGVIMTKLDGDARGGAALSVKAVTGVPIKYVGTGEQLEALEEFHPDRMAGRILGMGDVVSLVEQAREKFDEEEMAEDEARLREGQFTLDDFKKWITRTKKLGPLNKIMGMIPGMGGMNDMLDGMEAEQDMKRLMGIIDSMTPQERRNPTKTIDQSRRRRIAAGAGVQPHEVNELVKQFDGMAGMMKEMAGMGMRDRLRKVQQISQGPLASGGLLSKTKQGTGKRLSSTERAKMRKEREKALRRKKREQRRKK